jgi:RNA polymerase sigma-70 factor (ECF subfamily)
MPAGAHDSRIDEQELLQRVRRLDAAALGTVFDLYYAPLYRYLYIHLGHGPTAEDLAADVFRVLLEKTAAGQGPTEFLRAWLYRVAHNRMVDEIRRRKHREHAALDEQLEESLSADAGPAAALQSSGEKNALLEALQHLSEKQRAVLTLKYLQGLDNREIARALHMTAGTVRALQYRGLRALQRSLQNMESTSGELDEG